MQYSGDPGGADPSGVQAEGRSKYPRELVEAAVTVPIPALGIPASTRQRLGFGRLET
jgi:hypothetical protein